jgi:hypothetical protein
MIVRKLVFHTNEILGNVNCINVRPFSCPIPFLHLLLIFRLVVRYCCRCSISQNGPRNFVTHLLTDVTIKFHCCCVIAFQNSINFQVAQHGCHMWLCTNTHTNSRTVFNSIHVFRSTACYLKCFLYSHFNFCSSHVFRCILVGLDKPLNTNHNQTKICRPTHHFNVIPHSAAYFSSHEPSSGTYFYNILINIGTFQLAILSC